MKKKHFIDKFIYTNNNNKMNMVCNCGRLLADKQIQLDMIKQTINNKKNEGIDEMILLEEQAKFINNACDDVNKYCCKMQMLTSVSLVKIIK